jgi:ketosteroid isomerase-like protein
MPGDGLGGEEEMVALVRRAFERFEVGDVDGMLAYVHPDAEFIPIFMDSRSHRGRPAIRRIFEGAGARRRWRVDDLEVDVIGGRVLAGGRLHSVTTVGTTEDYPIAWVVDFADGLIVRMQSFVHRRQALAAIA